MNFIEKPFKVSYALTGNLSSWNEPVGIATREAISNMFKYLEDDMWYQEYKCEPTEDNDR
jgi:hypothetical protein